MSKLSFYCSPEYLLFLFMFGHFFKRRRRELYQKSVWKITPAIGNNAASAASSGDLQGVIQNCHSLKCRVPFRHGNRQHCERMRFLNGHNSRARKAASERVCSCALQTMRQKIKTGTGCHSNSIFLFKATLLVIAAWKTHYITGNEPGSAFIIRPVVKSPGQHEKTIRGRTLQPSVFHFVLFFHWVAYFRSDESSHKTQDVFRSLSGLSVGQFA